MDFADIRELLIKMGARPRQRALRRMFEFFEQQYQITLPEDVKSNYLVMNGIEPAGVASLAVIRFRPIEGWRPVHQRFTEDREPTSLPAQLFICADCAAESLSFSIDLSSSSANYGKVYGPLDVRQDVVAKSFSEFVAHVTTSTDFVFSYLYGQQP
jgi:cell wall assembly regulator SMI1